ncbi:MAG: response regulator [Myxococcales bacterium]
MQAAATIHHTSATHSPASRDERFDTTEPTDRDAPRVPTILLADDDPSVVEALREDLESMHYGIRVAYSGRECLAELGAGGIDLVLLDLMMPEVSGFQVLQSLSASTPLRNLPVVVLSARGNDAARALKAGAVDYVTKPWEPEELLMRVGTHLRLREREQELALAVTRLDQRKRELENEIVERKRAEARLAMASRMSSVGVVAAGVAHEINNPLTYLIGNLDLAHEQLNLPAIQKLQMGSAPVLRMVDQAREGAERVRLIVRDLKAFSRPDSEELESVNVVEVLESVLRFAGHEIKHRAKIEWDRRPTPRVVGNASRLSQVLLNIVANAAQAMEHGSPDRDVLRVETCLVSMDSQPAVEADVSARAQCSDDMLEIRLRDSGSGMDAYTAAHAFDLFYTTKTKGTGTGLGLALCRKIVEGFGGRIALRSERGKGTEVTVTLRVSHERDVAPGATRAAPAAPTSEMQKGHLLVIDDEPEIGALIMTFLARHYHVQVVHESTAALSLLRSGHHFDLVLCDLMMTGVNGIDLYETVRRELVGGGPPFVFMTGGPCTQRAAAFVKQHKSRVLEKPFSPTRLTETLEAARSH